MQSHSPSSHTRLQTIAGIWMVAATMIHLVALVIVAFILKGPRDNWNHVGIATGLVFGHAVIAAIWTRSHFDSSHRRVCICAVLLLPVLAMLIYAGRTGASAEICMLIFVSAIAQWLLALLPTFGMQKLGWQFSRGRPRPEEKRSYLQFHVRHIFVWTTAVAVLMGVGRLSLPRILELSHDEVFSFSVFFGIFVLGHTLLSVPLTWAILSRQQKPLWLGITIFLIVTIGYLELIGFKRLPIASRVGQPVLLIASVTGAFAATVLSFLVPKFLQGWRLTLAIDEAD